MQCMCLKALREYQRTGNLPGDKGVCSVQVNSSKFEYEFYFMEQEDMWELCSAWVQVFLCIKHVPNIKRARH